MNPKIRSQFKMLAAMWAHEAIAEIEQWPEQRAALKECAAAGREVRIVWHTKSQDITVEIVNADGTMSEVMRDQVIPDDGFAHIDIDTRQ